MFDAAAGSTETNVTDVLTTCEDVTVIFSSEMSSRNSSVLKYSIKVALASLEPSLVGVAKVKVIVRSRREVRIMVTSCSVHGKLPVHPQRLPACEEICAQQRT